MNGLPDMRLDLEVICCALIHENPSIFAQGQIAYPLKSKQILLKYHEVVSSHRLDLRLLTNTFYRGYDEIYVYVLADM